MTKPRRCGLSQGSFRGLQRPLYLERLRLQFPDRIDLGGWNLLYVGTLSREWPDPICAAAVAQLPWIRVMVLLACLDDLQTCTLVSYRPAPQGPGLLMSPSGWSGGRRAGVA